MHRVPGIAAVQQCQVTAELYGVQNLTGVNAVPNKLFSAWVTEQHLCRKHAQGPKHCCCAGVLVYSRAVWGVKLHRCKCSPKQAVFSLGCRAALVHAACTGFQALLLCNSVRLQQSCMMCITS